MAKPIKRHLRIGNAPAQDEGKLLVRMHRDDLPKGTKWNRYIHLTTKNTRITCKVRNNELVEVPHPRVHQLNINKHLRQILGIKTGSVYDFYVSKASFLRAPSYVLRFHPNKTVRQNMFTKIVLALVLILAMLGAAIYYFVF